MRPWWTLDEDAAPVDLAALDLFALPANEVPRPGCDGWVDPIDPCDLGPLSDDVNSEAPGVGSTGKPLAEEERPMKNRSPIGGQDVTPPIENSKTAKPSSARTTRMSNAEVVAAGARLIGRLRTMDEIAPRPQPERVEALPLFPGWK